MIAISGVCFPGKLSPEDLDERAMDALKEYNPDDAIAVLKQFCESSLEHVGNKSAFLCGMMKTYRQNKKQGAQASPARGPDPSKLSVSSLQNSVMKGTFYVYEHLGYIHSTR